MISTAIEEEVKMLYDAYHDGLEHYVAGSGPPPGLGLFPRRIAFDLYGEIIGVQGQQHLSTKLPSGQDDEEHEEEDDGKDCYEEEAGAEDEGGAFMGPQFEPYIPFPAGKASKHKGDIPAD